MVLIIGVSTAYLISTYTFPLRKHFQWLLLLPLAIPAYVIAYLYTDLLEFAGPIQKFLREIFAWKLATDYWFPNIRSMGGAIIMMGLVLYPYVYLMARASFIEQSISLREVSRLMGRSHLQTFRLVSFPIARPAIAIGVALALMETISDFGTVDFFAVQTLIHGLFDVWLNMNNLGGAAQIALVSLSFVLLLLGTEFYGRRRARFYQSNSRFKKSAPLALNGVAKWGATALCLIPVLFGFLIPAAMLIHYAIAYFAQSWSSEFVNLFINSLLVSTLSAGFCAAIAVIIVYSKRLHKSRLLTLGARLACIGYTVPGAVLAVGIVIPLAYMDNATDAFLRANFGISSGLLLSGSLFALILSLIIRFLAIAIGSVESSFSKVSQSIDMASRTLGYTPLQTLRRHNLPLIKSGIFTAALIVFVDCMKELPATLLLRPFNFETLATHVYFIASDEQIERAALGSLFIVIAGLIPVIILSRTISRSQNLDKAATL